MASLSQADKQNLNYEQQKQVLALKEQWAAANAIGDTTAMEKAHAAAEAIRASSANGAYSGGTSGNAYVSKSNGNNPHMSSNTANGNAALSGADNALLNADQQKQIAALKAQWAQANAENDQAGMDAAHQQAEAIRQLAGYTGGANGAGYSILGANAGGMTADQMQKWLEDYMYTNYDKNRGWTNGYSTAMNSRSKANKIRQQMLANEQAQANADDATKQYLHKQNLALAQLLYQYTGQSEKNTWYNDELGRWETINGNVGYGYNVTGSLPGVSDSWKKYYGYTDDDIARYANDNSHYYNFVDTRVPYRNRVDESSGYTGQYAQFVNGPYLQLLGVGTNSVPLEVYENVSRDGFMDNLYDIGAPDLKGNNAMTDYTNQFTSYVQGGVIQPGLLAASHPGGYGRFEGNNNGAYRMHGKTPVETQEFRPYMGIKPTPGPLTETPYNTLSDETITIRNAIDANDPRYTGGINRDVAASAPEDPNNLAGQLAYYQNYGKYGSAYGNGSIGGFGAGSYEDYINRMYAANLEAQMERLKAAYESNLSDLEAEQATVNDYYGEQKRQISGEADRQAANWREMANAYGLNSGAVGQAALAMNNQRQSDLNAIGQAQAAAQAEIQRQRTLLGKEYQAAINQALAEHNYERAYALYEEAVRAENMLWQKEKYYTDLSLSYLKMLL